MTFTILVVDDDVTLVNMMKENLEVEGYIVLTAYDGVMAVQAVQECKPHLVIMDFNMPGKGGLDAFHEIRGNREFNAIPVVFLTGEGMNAALNKVSSLPGVSHLVKPVDLDQLNTLTRQILSTQYPE